MARKDTWLKKDRNIVNVFMTIDLRAWPDCSPEVFAQRAAQHMDAMMENRERYAKTDADAAAHFRTHPEVYGASTPEMIERFEKNSRTKSLEAMYYRGVAAKIRAGLMPPRNGIEMLPPNANAHDVDAAIDRSQT